MSWISDTWRSGYLPLQHPTFEADGLTIRTRHMRHAVRIVGRLDGPNELGHYIIGELDGGQGTHGDIVGGMIWDNERTEITGGDRTASLRELPAWSFAWPAIIVSNKKKVLKARPIFDDKLEADDRFVPLVVHSSSDLAVGRHGVVLDAIKEDEQILLFLADGDDPLVAHWRGLDPNDLSTLVSDIDDEGKIDENRKAPLDTAWRVSKPLSAREGGAGGRGAKKFGPRETGPLNRFMGGGKGFVEIQPSVPLDPKKRPGSEGGERGEVPTLPDQVLAWNITSSPSEQGYGMMVGRSLDAGLPEAPGMEPAITTSSTSGSVGDQYGKVTSGGSIGDDYGGASITSGPLSLAYAGVERGGYAYVGAGLADKHNHGVNADGEPVGPGHLQVNSLFFGSEEMDAVLEFQLVGYPESSIFQHTVEVHLKYDAEATHTYIGGDGKAAVAKGRWRWHSFTPFLPCNPGVAVVPFDEPQSMIVPNGQLSSNSPGGGNPGNKLFPPRLTADKLSQRGIPFILSRASHLTENAFQHLALAANQNIRPERVAGVGLDNELLATALAFRPMKVQLAGGDLRYADQKTIQQHEDREHAPVAMRFEAFGKQDISSITDWSYGEEPFQENGRYVMGTAASGGAAFLPSNFGIEDVFGIEPPGVVAAPTYMVQCRTIFSIAQFIAPELGRPVVGFDWAQNAANDLQATAVDAQATETPVYRIDADGHWEYQVGTRHPTRPVTDADTIATQFDHTINMDPQTANRTVTLPDATQFGGLVLWIKNVHFTPPGAARKVIIQPILGQQIENDTDFKLSANGEAVIIQAEGGNWFLY